MMEKSIGDTIAPEGNSVSGPLAKIDSGIVKWARLIYVPKAPQAKKTAPVVYPAPDGYMRRTPVQEIRVPEGYRRRMILLAIAIFLAAVFLAAVVYVLINFVI